MVAEQTETQTTTVIRVIMTVMSDRTVISEASYMYVDVTSSNILFTYKKYFLRKYIFLRVKILFT